MIEQSTPADPHKIVMTTLPYPPGPRNGRLPGEQWWAFRRDPLAFLTRMARQHGDIVCFRVGPRQLYLLNHPDFIKAVLVDDQRNFVKSQAFQRARVLLGDGLLTSEGELHLRQRRMIQPAFSQARIAGYAQYMVEGAASISRNWQDGQVVDMQAEMAHLTMGIVTRALFGVDVDDEASELRQATADLVAQFNLLTSPVYAWMQRLPARLAGWLPINRSARRAAQRLEDLVQGMIASRRGNGNQADDLLARLLAAQDGETGMSDRQVRDEVMTLFLAGHGTTANALTWTWYLLAQSPAVGARLHAELSGVLNGRHPSAVDLESLPYTRRVLSESLRLYPPAWVIARQALADYPLGGYCIPRGATVLISPWVTQRDPRYFSDPLRFDPERWRPGQQAGRPLFAYFPFGGGPRVCIGEHFAWMAMTLALAILAQDWKPGLLPGCQLTVQPAITLRPRNGLRMILQSRKPQDR
ncbi:MAG: cytochrome P450 [Chloroflexota bacterium]